MVYLYRMVRRLVCEQAAFPIVLKYINVYVNKSLYKHTVL